MDFAPSDPSTRADVVPERAQAHAPQGDDAKPAAAWADALVALLRFHRLAAEPAQIMRSVGGGEGGEPAPSANDMVRHLRGAGLRARAAASSVPHLATTPLPAIALNDDGSCVLLARASAERVLILDPQTQQPKILPMAEFAAHWTGQLILATRRASLGDLGRRFDITWFCGAIHKYRRLLGEVLAASLVPAALRAALAAVLPGGHRQGAGASRLVHARILVVGLALIAVFEAMLGALRTYVFAHTTNRIDVELGARLFRHLLALPLAYFQARRVGDSVARVRELENIRNFLTSSALTLVIDLLFTIVFLARDGDLLAWLTWIVLASFPFYILISASA